MTALRASAATALAGGTFQFASSAVQQPMDEATTRTPPPGGGK